MNFFDLILVAALKEYKSGDEKQIIKPKDNKIIFVKMQNHLKRQLILEKQRKFNAKDNNTKALKFSKPANVPTHVWNERVKIIQNQYCLQKKVCSQEAPRDSPTKPVTDYDDSLATMSFGKNTGKFLSEKDGTETDSVFPNTNGILEIPFNLDTQDVRKLPSDDSIPGTPKSL